MSYQQLCARGFHLKVWQTIQILSLCRPRGESRKPIYNLLSL